MKESKDNKEKFLHVFVAIVLVLGIVRLLFPSVTGKTTETGEAADSTAVAALAANDDTEDIDGSDNGKASGSDSNDAEGSAPAVNNAAEGSNLAANNTSENDTANAIVADASNASGLGPDNLVNVPEDATDYSAGGERKKHRIFGVHSYRDCFPDLNDVQLASAQRYGVQPVANREDAEMRKSELVFVGANPYFFVQPLSRSIPYLVPRASVLLQDIGRAFFDSLDVKGLPLHKIIVTSVLRSKDDVDRLRRYNRNATENSCHQYGTTFDITYNRYKTVEDPNGPKRREVRNDTLKWILSEVLRDMRAQNRCYVKYEVHQGCFHITTR